MYLVMEVNCVSNANTGSQISKLFIELVFLVFSVLQWRRPGRVPSL